MPLPAFSDLRARLLLLVLVAITPVFGLVLYAGFEQRSHLAQAAQNRALQLAREASRNHEGWIAGAHQLLIGLAQLPAVRNKDSPACTALFGDVLKRSTIYANVAAATPDGDVFCSGAPLREPVNLGDRPYFHRTLETRGLVVSEYLIGRIIRQPILTLSYPATDRQGVIRAVVILALDLAWLGQLAATGQLPEGSSLLVFDRNGVLLASHPDGERWAGKSLSEVPIVRAALAQQEGVAEAPGPDGRQRLWGFTVLVADSEIPHLHLAVGIPPRVAFAPANRSLIRNLIALGLLTVLGLVGARVAADSLILRRVNALASAAKRLAAGDLGARTGLSAGPGQLGHLISAFDQMASELQARQADIDRAMRAAEAERRKLYTVLEELPAAVFLLAPDYSIRFANGYFRRRWGDPQGRRCYEVVCENAVPPEACPCLRVFETGSPEHGQLARSDGTSYEIYSYPFRDPDGSHLLLVLGIDVTEGKRAQEQLQRHREALFHTEKLAAMGQLLAGVAHELNNPLSVVLGLASLLRETVNDERLAESVQDISQAAERCARIVKNFLALARQHPPERRQGQLNQIVKEAVELLAYPLRVDNVEARLDLAEDLPALWCDSHQLHQVLVNLITNAYQAMRETLPPRRLILTTRFHSTEGQASLEVADTGPGIPPEIQSRVFEPFFTTKPPGQGTGLGLSLCLGIVESHGGTIRVTSTPGQGAVFRVELPVGAPPKVRPGVGATEAPVPIRGKAVLVVDDESQVARVLAGLLAVDGHRVDTAANGAVALEKLQERAYDLILTDMRMPELDGQSLYRTLERWRPELCRRFVFLTGDTLSPETRVFLEQSGGTTLSKPFTLADVRQAVQRTLATSASPSI